MENCIFILVSWKGVDGQGYEGAGLCVVLRRGVDGRREERWVTQFGLTKLSITTTTLRRWCALPLSNGPRASLPPIVHWVTTHGGWAMLNTTRCLSTAELAQIGSCPLMPICMHRPQGAHRPKQPSLQICIPVGVASVLTNDVQRKVPLPFTM